MGIVRTGETEYDKEMARWDLPKRLGGHNADGYERYPQMLYKAFRDDSGRMTCMMPPPLMHLYLSMPEYLRAESIAKAFTDQCQTTVRTDAEYARKRDEGWRDTPAEALAHAEVLQREIADAAAEEQFRVRRMSEQAQREFAAANAGDAHVPDPAAPKKRPGRKAKPLATVGA